MGPFKYEIYHVNLLPDGIGGNTTKETLFQTVNGWMDLFSGTDRNTIQNAQTQDSTHILITDKFYVGIEDSMFVKHEGKKYQITLVDNPVSVGHHLELYLKLDS